MDVAPSPSSRPPRLAIVEKGPEDDQAAHNAALERSQTLIVNLYTLIALVYCALSAWIFYTVGNNAFEGHVHLFGGAIIAANYVILQQTRNYTVATHVILFVGTWVVGSLFGTGGWDGSGAYWTFAYLPYAFFLGSTAVARFWVAVLMGVDLGLVALHVAGTRRLPYSDTVLVNFFAALAVFILCMFLFKRAVLQSERLAESRSQDLAISNAQLKASESDLAQAQHSAHLGSFAWNPSDDASTWSLEMREIFGLEPKAATFGVVGLRGFVHVEDGHRLDEMVTRTKDGLPVDDELRIVRTDGVVRSLHIRGRPERDDAGKVQRYVGTAQDVTETREAEEARRRAMLQLQELESLKDINRLKTEFMNTAAHELSTPLTPINLELRVLKKPEIEESPERRRKSIEILDRNVARLSLLVRDLLDGARLQSSKVALKRQPVDLSPLVHEAAKGFSTVAEVAGIHLEIKTVKEMWVDADPKRLSQVLDNFISNAIKFTPSGGTVTLHGLRGSGGVSVRIEDNGIGLRAEDILRLFAPFSQVHSTMERTRSGTGLGLYICKGIIEAHGGRVGVTSAGPGKGSTFWFVLPAGETLDSSLTSTSAAKTAK